MKNEMKNQMEELRGEMQRIGRGLQAGLMAIACDETTEHKMAVPRAGANELRGSVDCVGPAVEDKVIRETCKTRLVQVTEKVTVTEREKLNGMTETCIRHVKTKEIDLTATRSETQEIKEITETREIEKVEERLHDKDGVKDEHTHMELVEDSEGELEECVVTRCKQPDSLLQEWRETLCSLEADLDQVGPVELCDVEGASAVDWYTLRLGGMETPGPLVVALIPSAIVPVCVVSVCVYTSVAKCVLQRAHSVGERRCVKGSTRPPICS